MQSRTSELFLKYLRNLPQELKANVEHMVAEAETSPGMLSRIFNDFPSSYQIKNQTYQAFDPKISKDLFLKAKNILSTVEFSHEDAEYGQINQMLLNSELLRDFVREMVSGASHTLLTEEGRIKPEIVEVLNLQYLLNAAKIQKKEGELVFRILFSYCTQLLMAQLTADLVKDNDPDQSIGLFFLAVERLAKSAFYEELLGDFIYQNHIFSTEILIKNLNASELENITNLVLEDIATPIDLIDGRYSVALLKEKTKSWVDVMHALMDRSDIERVQAILKGLPTFALNTLNEDETLGFMFKGYQQSLKQAYDAQQESKMSLAETKRSDEFILWQNRRNNYFLLELLLQQSLHENSSNQGIERLRAELQIYKDQRHIIEMPTLSMFELIYKNTPHKEELTQLLSSELPDLAWQLELNATHTSPFTIHLKYQKWDHLFQILLNQSQPEAREVKLFSKEQRHALVNHFINYLERLPANEANSLLQKTIAKKNALGMMFATPTNFIPSMHKDAQGNRVTGSIKKLLNYQETLQQKLAIEEKRGIAPRERK